MRIAVVGAGAVGGFFGGLMAHRGADVVFIARGDTQDALRRDGLRIRSKLAGDFDVPVSIFSDPAGVEPVDLLVFSVKAYDLESAARSVIGLVGADTTVLAVQNGIDHHLKLRALLGTERVVPGIVYVSANVESPGVIHQLGGPGMIHFGKDRAGNVANHDLDRIGDALDAAGIGNVRHPEIDRELWHKFMFICAMSGVSALTRLTLRQIFDCLETGALYYDVMAEVAAVARASGVDLAESAPDEVMETLLASGALPERGSMAYDLMAGRRLELDMLNGTVVRLGHQRGIQVPANHVIYAALKPFAAGAPAS